MKGMARAASAEKSVGNKMFSNRARVFAAVAFMGGFLLCLHLRSARSFLLLRTSLVAVTGSTHGPRAPRSVKGDFGLFLDLAEGGNFMDAQSAKTMEAAKQAGRCQFEATVMRKQDG